MARSQAGFGSTGAALLAGVSLCFSLWSGPALAQGYPSKPVRLIVPSGPGGAPDLLGRLIAQKLAEGLGQQVVVEHRPGAGGSIGMEAVARAAPDGYTLGLSTTSALAVAPSLYPNLAYDPASSFAAVSLLTTGNFVIVVHPSVPANSLKELIDLAKSRPGRLNYASVGNGTPHHIAGETFKIAAGVDIVHVPYKTGAHIGLLSNSVQIMFEGLGPLLASIRAGKVRALAVAGQKRFPQVPEIPTAAEAGLPGYEITAHMGLVAPKETPREIVRNLNAIVVKAMEVKEVSDMFLNQGVVPTSSTSEQYSEIIRADVVRWLRASRAAGAKLD